MTASFIRNGLATGWGMQLGTKRVARTKYLNDLKNIEYLIAERNQRILEDLVDGAPDTLCRTFSFHLRAIGYLS